MFYGIRLALCLGALAIPASFANAMPPCERPITSSIISVSDLKCEEAFFVAKIINRYSNLYFMDWRLIVAIIAQESSFRLDAKNCKTGMAQDNKGNWVSKKVCYDFGPVQFNHKNIKNLNLDINKLLTDWDYSIKHMVIKLHKLKKRWQGVDPEFWWCRYHSSTTYFKHLYYEKVMSIYEKIKEE